MTNESVNTSDTYSQSGVSVRVIEQEPHTCSYLPDRTARHEYLFCKDLTSAQYQEFMNQNFRRSGCLIYRPVCDNCRECIPLRVPVQNFQLSRSQSRAVSKNRDVSIRIAPPLFTAEKWALYQRYQSSQHDGSMIDDCNSFKVFLFESPIDTLEMTYMIDDRVIGVGIVDVCPDALSSVYFFFDPEESRRSLGVFSAIREIEECRSMGKAFWYAGFYVSGCQKMNYKARFRPYELLTNDEWRSPEDSSNNPHRDECQHKSDGDVED